MGGGDEVPNNGAESRDVHSSEETTFQAAAAAENESGGFASFFGAFLGQGEAAPSFPSYVAEELRVAAIEEAALARGAIVPRADAWKEEEGEALREGRPADLNLKFIYGWTLCKVCKEYEHRRGAAILQELLEDSAYSFPDECAYGLSFACYIQGNLQAARHWCETLLRMRPDSDRARKLHVLIRGAQGHRMDKTLEATAVGGAVLVGLAGLALAMAAGGSRR
jgi:hypothetical protein